jgi:protein ImuA
MMKEKSAVIDKLKKDLLLWQGFKPPSGQQQKMDLGSMELAFPNGVFPLGRMHEFIAMSGEEAAASTGFMSGLLASIIHQGGFCLWIGLSKRVFAPAMQAFGIVPHGIIFVQMNCERDVRWALEEALQCEGLAAVVAELRELTFVQSRRLQLLVEKSGVTAFVLRHQPHTLEHTACVARWHISSTRSISEDGLPGVGCPSWNVQLLKVRNGHPGKWHISWSAGKFEMVVEADQISKVRKKKVS